MIGTLCGTIEEIICDDQVILNTGEGIGYVVHLPYRTVLSYKPQDSAKFYIETSVNRDNVPQLYGFLTKEEQSCMRMLIKVSGVNYKTALAILGKLTPDQIFNAIVTENKVALKVGGIGDKLLNRIITELAPKIQKLGLQVPTRPTPQCEDAAAALLSLGYERTKVLHVLQKVDTSLAPEEIVLHALKELSSE